jgi:membrane protease YdiL (CAAX protease family)
VVWVILAFSLRQWLNRYTAHANRKKPRDGTRGATARKQRSGGILAAVATIVGIVAYGVQGFVVLHNVSDAAQRSDPDIVIVDHPTMLRIEAIRRRAEDKPAANPSNAQLAGEIHPLIWRMLERQPDAGDDDEISRRASAAIDVFTARGFAAFREASSGAWYGPADSPAMLGPLGLVALMIACSVALTGLVGGNLAKDAQFEWWFTFPVPARGLLLARGLGMAITPFVWTMVAPFFCIVFWSAGYGWVGVPLGLAMTLYTGLVAGALRIATETALPRLMSPANVARLQAAFSTLVLVLMFALLAMVSPYGSHRMIALARQLPSWLLVNPFAPIAFAAGGAQAWTAALACLLLAIVAIVGATAFGAWMLSDGLSPGDTEQSRRRRATAKPSRRSWTAALGPVAWRELTLLLRDRGRFAGVFVFPAIVVGAQLLMAPPDLRGSDAALGVAIALAFGSSVIVLGNGASAALARDVPALWLIYTLPTSIERILLRQALFWICLAILFALAVFALVSQGDAAKFLAGAPRLAVMAVGIALNGFIATALGALGTDALEPNPARRIRRASLRVFMVVAALFGYALYGASTWAIFVQLVLSALLAYAFWQKLRDHVPLLLDPSEAPAPSLAVTDGLIAALAFMVLQGVLALGIEFVFNVGDDIAALSPGALLAFAFVGAGLIVAAASMLAFARSGRPDLRTSLGLRLPRQGLARGVLIGIAGGLAGGLVAAGYLALVARVPFLRELREQTVALSPDDTNLAPWLIAIAIGAAPIFEEFIFRAVLYGGFRRSLDPVRAALCSAALFAIIHPPISSAPVFVLGLIAAAGYERSRSLVVPIVVHMVYNAITTGLAWWHVL